MQTTKSLNDDFFLRNAIHCWLHHFPDHKWTPIYQELAMRESFTESTAAKPRAARRRKPKLTTGTE